MLGSCVHSGDAPSSVTAISTSLCPPTTFTEPLQGRAGLGKEQGAAAPHCSPALTCPGRRVLTLGLCSPTLLGTLGSCHPITSTR